MNRRFLAIFVASILCMLSLGKWTPMQAQTPPPNAPLVISLPFNPSTDGEALRPLDRPESDRPYDSGREIIGLDDRSPVLTRAFPWSTMGRLEWTTANSVTGWCTATLIDDDLLLSNAHCLTRALVDSAGRPVVDSNGQRVTAFTNSQTYQSIPDTLIFKPGMIRGVSLDRATVVSYQSGWTAISQPSGEDWALLKIDQPLGSANYYGHMGWRSLDFSDSHTLEAIAEKIRLAGYSGDFPTESNRQLGEPGETAGADEMCSILAQDDSGDWSGTLFHDCDTRPGASGSAIFARFTNGEYYVLGLHSGSLQMNEPVQLPDGVTTNVVNQGVQVSRWAPQAITMRQSG